ncbi:MAG: RNA methyltransferase, partial [Acidobacteriota bacterium]
MNEIKKITSRDNQRLVSVRKVRDGKAPERIFIEGRRLVEEALRSAIAISECFVVEGFQDSDLLNAVGMRTTSIAGIPEKVFSTIADTQQPQGIILIAKRPNTSAETIKHGLVSAALPIVVFLNEINNPSNLGAVLRTAEAAGVGGVIVSNNSSSAYSPKALRAAMGSTFRLRVWENANFDEVLAWAREGNFTTTSCDISATKSYASVDWKKPRLLIFGSEAH